MNRLLIVAGSALLIVAGRPAPAAAEDASPLARFQQEAQAYEMQLGDKQPAPLELDAKPILHWDNPAGNGEDGAVFIWQQHGRPEVIGTFFTYRRASTG